MALAAPCAMLAFRPLFDVHVDLAEIVTLGRTPLGERRVINILGGWFRGERLAGHVRPGGADWQTVGDDGAARLDARYTLETAGGAFIQVSARASGTARQRSWPGWRPERSSTPRSTTSGPCCDSRPARRTSAG